MRATLANAAALTLLGAALAIAQGTARPQPKSPDDVERLTAAQTQEALAAGTAVLVDTRDPGSYDTEHAKGAVSYFRVETGPTGATLPREKLVITYCT